MFIPITSPERMQHFLDASNTHPLYFYELHLGEQHSEVTILSRRLVLYHFKRVHSARLLVNNDLVDPKHSPENFQSGTAEVRSLDLYYVSSHSSSASFLPALDFPCLRELSCYGAFAPFSRMMNSPSLRLLDIQHPYVKPTPQELLSLLRNLPVLEDLSLRDVCSGYGSLRGAPAVSPIPLLRLQRFAIQERFIKDGIPIFQHIEYPITAAVSLACDLHALSPSAEDDRALLGALFAKIKERATHGSLPPPNVRSACIEIDKRSTLSITMQWEPKSLEELNDERANGQVPNSFRFALYQEDAGLVAPNDWIHDLFESLSAPLSTVKSLLLSDLQPAPTRIVHLPMTMLGTLPSLENIALEYETFPDPPDEIFRELAREFPLDICELFEGVRAVRILEYRHNTWVDERGIRPSKVKRLAKAFMARGAEAKASEGGGRSGRREDQKDQQFRVSVEHVDWSRVNVRPRAAQDPFSSGYRSDQLHISV